MISGISTYKEILNVMPFLRAVAKPYLSYSKISKNFEFDVQIPNLEDYKMAPFFFGY